MSHWDNLQTPQVKLRRRSSIFNIVLPGKLLIYRIKQSSNKLFILEKSVQNESDFEKYKLALQQEASDWVHLLKNHNRQLKLYVFILFINHVQKTLTFVFILELKSRNLKRIQTILVKFKLVFLKTD